VRAVVTDAPRAPIVAEARPDLRALVVGGDFDDLLAVRDRRAALVSMWRRRLPGLHLGHRASPRARADAYVRSPPLALQVVESPPTTSARRSGRAPPRSVRAVHGDHQHALGVAEMNVNSLAVSAGFTVAATIPVLAAADTAPGSPVVGEVQPDPVPGPNTNASRAFAARWSARRAPANSPGVPADDRVRSGCCVAASAACRPCSGRLPNDAGVSAHRCTIRVASGEGEL